ncbi:unnamed protein product [Somion occarium]|uniref:ferric-chelate reductase (NADPH) n=1 Tax=Somion occarium TaxID=3059160 RepID=A0ABP1D9C8_9APHY
MSGLSPNPPTPILLNDLQWLTAYLTVHSLSDASKVYSYILWIAIGVILLVYSIVHRLGLKGGYIGALWSKWALRRRTWRKKHALAMAVKKREPHKQPKSLPSNAQILSLTALVVGSLALAYIGPDYLAPGTQIWNVGKAPSAKRATTYDPALFLPFQAKYTIPKAWWSTAARTGQIAFALFPLCILLALKTPPFAVFSISFLTDIHFDKLSFLHRWCGMLIWFITTLHVISWSVQLSQDQRKGRVLYTYAWQYQKFIFGWTAYGILTLIMICSIPPIRKRHYEMFYFLHILLIPPTLVLAALHHPPVWWWCWGALAGWAAERLYRFFWFLHTNGAFGGVQYSQKPAKLQKKSSFKRSKSQSEVLQMHTLNVGDANSGHDPAQKQSIPYPSASSVHRIVIHDEGYVPPPGFVHAELLPGRTVRLRIVPRGFVSWAPGQHFLINIPAVAWCTTHPFTAASICDAATTTDAGREILFLVRAKKGWTKHLWDTVAIMGAHNHKLPLGESIPANARLPPRGVLMRGFVDGPFGSSTRASWGTYPSVLLVAGGSGVSFTLSVLQYLCLCIAGRDGRELGARSGGWGKPNFKTTRVRFVWLIREFGHIQWCASALRKCLAILPSPELQIDIFVTNMKPAQRIPRSPQVLDQKIQDIDDEGELEPPSPQFARESQYGRPDKHRSRSPSVSSIESEDSVHNDVDLSYYEGGYNEQEDGELGHEEHALDLTNFDGDDDTELPGEAQLNLSVKQEGKRRRSYLRRASVAFVAKQDLDKRSTAIYEYSHSPSAVHLLDPPRPTSLPPPSLQPITEHIRLGSSSRISRDMDYLRSPGSSTDVQTPTSAVGLLANDRHPSLPYSSAWSPPSPQESPQLSHLGSATFTHPLANRPTSMLSAVTTAWSDSHSLAALVSQASLKDQIRLELDDGELADIGVVAERARPGKPRLDRILADEVQRSQGCGPTSLNALMRKSIAAQIDPARIRRGDMRGHIALVAEDFEY